MDAAHAHPRPATAAPPSSLGRVLIVDDEVELMSTLCEMLSKQGYETAGVACAPEAREALRQRDFDLLLTDLMMPDTDGITLLREALAIDPHVVGIIMTGQGTIQSAVEAMKMGAFDYVLKPFKLSAILPVLSRAMEMRRLRLDYVQLRESVAMYELSMAVAFTLDMNVILNKVADAALQQGEADEVTILLPTPAGSELQVAAARGPGAERRAGMRVPVEGTAAGWVAQHRELLTVDGNAPDPRFAPLEPSTRPSTAVVMPMLVGGTLVGVLHISARRPFTLGQVKALSIFAGIAASALESARLYAQARDAEQYFRSLIENASDLISILLADGTIRYVSPSHTRLLGYAPEDLVGKNAFAFVHADDLRTVRDLFARGVADVGGTGVMEFRFRRKDGSWGLFEGIGKNLLSDPAVAGLIITSRDVTERKRAEAELHTRARQQAAVAELGRRAVARSDLSALMDDVVALVARTLQVEYAKVLELLPGGAAFLLRAGVGWQAGAVGHATVGAGRDSQAGYTLTCGQSVIVEDLRSERRFTGPALLHDHKVVSGVSVIIHGSDYPFGVLGAHTTVPRTFSTDDVHFLQTVANVLAAAIERQRTDDALRESEARLRTLNIELERRVVERTAQLEAANKELESFSYSVSHDLRAPLRAIEGFSTALLEDYAATLDADGRQYFKRIVSATAHMAQLIDDLLGLARVTRSEMRRQEVDLSAIAEIIATELQKSQPERQVEFVIAREVVVEGDPHLLRAALENLLGNAWKYTGKRPHARIEFGQSRNADCGSGIEAEAGGDSAIRIPQSAMVYFVRDNGAGFDMAYADKLFGAFQRLHSRADFEGTGIGLATAQRIIHRHGGRIWAEGAVDEGATFYFTLPEH